MRSTHLLSTGWRNVLYLMGAKCAHIYGTQVHCRIYCFPVVCASAGEIKKKKVFKVKGKVAWLSRYFPFYIYARIVYMKVECGFTANSSRAGIVTVRRVRVKYTPFPLNWPPPARLPESKSWQATLSLSLLRLGCKLFPFPYICSATIFSIPVCVCAKLSRRQHATKK